MQFNENIVYMLTALCLASAVSSSSSHFGLFVDYFRTHSFSTEIFCVTLIKSYCLIMKLGRNSNLTWDLSNAESGYL